MDKKTLLVFGGSGGIGQALCDRADKSKYNIVIADVKEPVKNCKCDYIHADLTREADVKRSILYALDLYQTIEAVVNCQGIYLVDHIEKINVDEFERLIDINLKSVFLVCKSIIPVMKWQKNGYIINISSMSGIRGKSGHSAYCASKFAVVGLSDAISEELKGTNVRVTSVCPSSVNTGMLHEVINLNDEESSAILQPQDVARVILNLIESPGRVVQKVVAVEGKIDLDKVSRKK